MTCRHFGRSRVPRLRTCAESAGTLAGDEVCRRRLEKARSGLSDLVDRWAHRLKAGDAARIWSNARRRILLVKSEWDGGLPAELPGQPQIEHWLGRISQEIARLQNHERHEALSNWRRRMQTSQSARIRWAKAKYAKFQSVPDNAAAFRSVEEVWRPVMRRYVGLRRMLVGTMRWALWASPTCVRKHSST